MTERRSWGGHGSRMHAWAPDGRVYVAIVRNAFHVARPGLKYTHSRLRDIVLEDRNLKRAREGRPKLRAIFRITLRAPTSPS